MLVFFDHVAYRRTHSGSPVTKLRGTGAPGEIVTLSFSISSERECRDVELLAEALHGQRQNVDARCIDVHIVKIWQQSGIGVYQSESMAVPELLLKDDRVSLKDGYRRDFKRLRHLMEPFWLYDPPVVRLDGPAKTSLQQHQSKQIIVSIRIPKTIPSGDYAGDLSITADGAKHRLPIVLSVLPIVLAEPRQDTMIWYKGSIDWRNRQHYVPKEIFRLQLKDIYECGFRSITINEIDTGHAQRAIDIAEEIGFDRNIVIVLPRCIELTKLRFSKARPVYLIGDELDLQIGDDAMADLHEHPQVKAYIKTWNFVKDLPGRTLSTIYREPNARRLAEKLAIPASTITGYYLGFNTDFMFFFSQFEQMRDSEVYYFWSAHMEKPDLHRVLCGWYLWKSRASGIQPYCYQHLPKYPFSPYDDFDHSEDNEVGDMTARSYRDHLATYPSRHGPIPTLQWFGMRDGLTDLRYLATLDYMLQRAESRAGSQGVVEHVRAELAKIMRTIDLREVSIRSDTDPRPYMHIDSADYHAFRIFCADSILRLQSLIGEDTAAIESALNTGAGCR